MEGIMIMMHMRTAMLPYFSNNIPVRYDPDADAMQIPNRGCEPHVWQKGDQGQEMIIHKLK
jgi:hypothetical protein